MNFELVFFFKFEFVICTFMGFSCGMIRTNVINSVAFRLEFLVPVCNPEWYYHPFHLRSNSGLFQGVSAVPVNSSKLAAQTLSSPKLIPVTLEDILKALQDTVQESTRYKSPTRQNNGLHPIILMHHKFVMKKKYKCHRCTVSTT